MVKYRFLSCFALLSALVISGCASGPKLSTVRNRIPAPRADEARLFVYRSSAFGAAVQPDVKLNSAVIGTAKPDAVTFVDLKPGTYKVECTTEVTNDVTFTLAAGQTQYIKLVPTFGVLIGHIDPRIVSKNEGEDDIKDLSFVASPQMKSRLPAGLVEQK